MKRLMLTLFVGVFAAQNITFAQEPIEEPIHVDGTTIAEPELPDYEYANRVPGFSPITEIVDLDGNPASP